MKGVLWEAGYAALKVCHQVYYCLEADSMAAIHGDDIIAEGLAAIVRIRSKTGAKPQSSPGSKRWQHMRVEWEIRHAVLCQKTERDDDEAWPGWQDISWRIPVDSDLAGSEERYSTHGGLEFHGGHLVDSWVASVQVRALSSGDAELCGIVDSSARVIFTKHMYEEMGRTINVDVKTDSPAATRMCGRTGVGNTRHIQVRWLWIARRHSWQSRSFEKGEGHQE